MDAINLDSADSGVLYFLNKSCHLKKEIFHYVRFNTMYNIIVQRVLP